jgi:MFS family permease
MMGMSILSYFSIILALITFRFLGLIIFFVTSEKVKTRFEEQTVPSYSMALGSKGLTLYLSSWIMFCLVNWLELPIIGKLFGQELSALSGLIEITLSGVSALLGGFFSDKIGRKRVVVAGFVFLGIGYAVLGLFLSNQIVWYIYMVLDGIAWGIFAVVFFMVLWGDLAENARKERFYLIGGLPYLLAGYLSVLVQPYLSTIQLNTLFSFASLFLFLAVLPLLYAPETLPEKKIRERELKQYIDKAKKTREKYT